MNSHSSSKQAVGRRRGFRAAHGQSYLELAFVLPVLAIVLVVAADFGRLFYTYVGVINAARAGAQYGSNSVTTAADATGMSTAAKQDGVNIANLTVSASQCTCETATSSIPACSSNFCANDPQGNYVVVNTQVLFNTIVEYPGIPSPITLTGQAVMQVQQQ